MEEEGEEDILKTFPIKKYFTPQQYARLTEEERRRHAKTRQNYEVLSKLGMPVTTPEFMLEKSKFVLEGGVDRRLTRQCASPGKNQTVGCCGGTLANNTEVKVALSSDAAIDDSDQSGHSTPVGNMNEDVENMTAETGGQCDQRLGVGTDTMMTGIGPHKNMFKIVGFLFDVNSLTAGKPLETAEPEQPSLKSQKKEDEENGGANEGCSGLAESKKQQVCVESASKLQRELSKFAYTARLEESHPGIDGPAGGLGSVDRNIGEPTEEVLRIDSMATNDEKEPSNIAFGEVDDEVVEGDDLVSNDVDDASVAAGDDDNAEDKDDDKEYEDISGEEDVVEDDEIDDNVEEKEICKDSAIFDVDNVLVEDDYVVVPLSDNNAEDDMGNGVEEGETSQSEQGNITGDGEGRLQSEEAMEEDIEEGKDVDGDEEEKEQRIVIVVETEEDEVVVGHVSVQERSQTCPAVGDIKAEKARREMVKRLKRARLKFEEKRKKDFQEAKPPPPPKPKAEYPCGICGFVFRRSTHLRRHQMSRMGKDGLTCIRSKNNSPPKEFRCEICGVVFNRRFNLNRHIEQKHGEKKEEGGEEGDSDERVKNRSFDSLSNSNTEKNLALDVTKEVNSKIASSSSSADLPVKINKFTCDECGKAFNRSNNLKRHRLTHMDEKPFKCVACGVGFKQAGHLVEHERIHTGEKPFECSVCKQRFSRHQHLVSHKLVHSKEKHFKCDVCGKEFARKDYLTCHKRTHEKVKVLTCDVCGKVCQTIPALFNHKKTHDERYRKAPKIKEKKMYACEICGVEYKDLVALVGHKKIHVDVKVECDICEMQFSHEVYLASHKRCHRDRLKCDVCGKCYAKELSLKAHKQLHKIAENQKGTAKPKNEACN